MSDDAVVQAAALRRVADPSLLLDLHCLVCERVTMLLGVAMCGRPWDACRIAMGPWMLSFGSVTFVDVSIVGRHCSMTGGKPESRDVPMPDRWGGECVPDQPPRT